LADEESIAAGKFVKRNSTLDRNYFPRALRVIAVALLGTAFFFFDRLTISGFWGRIVALASGVAFASVALSLGKESAGSPHANVILGSQLVAVGGIPFIVRGSLGAGRLVAAHSPRNGAIRVWLRLLQGRDQTLNDTFRGRARRDLRAALIGLRLSTPQQP
jgi:hypothetical protein